MLIPEEDFFLVNKQSNSAIGTAAENPRLMGVEHEIKNTEVFSDLVTSENLERNDEGVGNEIVVGSSVENLDGSVIGSRSEEGVFGMETNRSYGVCVVSESLVRLSREVEVEPIDFLVVRAYDEVVTAGMDVERRNPLNARVEFLDKFLFYQVVNLDLTLSGNEEVRFRGVELDALHLLLRFRERRLCESFRDLMDEYWRVNGSRRYRREVVTLVMPCESLKILSNSVGVVTKRKSPSVFPSARSWSSPLDDRLNFLRSCISKARHIVK